MLTTMIVLNVVLVVALLAGLAFIMSRASLLTPHKPGVTGNAWRLRRPLRHSAAAASSQHAERPRAQPLRPALDRS